jgi:GH18 family chitinase
VPIFPVLSSEHALTVPASLLLQLLSSNGSTGLNGFKRRFDSCSQTPFLFNPDKKQLIAYDDGKSASVKAVRRFRSFFL